MEIIDGLYLIDIIALILCLRIIYISVFRGFLNEGFKVVGLLCAALLAFHYYPALAHKIGAAIPFLNAKYVDFIFFFVIFFSIMGVFSVVRRILAVFYKREESPSAGERWFALLLGAVRFVVLTSVIFFFLNLYSINPAYFSDSISYLFFRKAAPKMYLVSFNIFNKFYPEIKLNKEVEEYYEARNIILGNSKKGH